MSYIDFYPIILIVRRIIKFRHGLFGIYLDFLNCLLLNQPTNKVSHKLNDDTVCQKHRFLRKIDTLTLSLCKITGKDLSIKNKIVHSEEGLQGTKITSTEKAKYFEDSRN
jgi:hypothetical protein